MPQTNSAHAKVEREASTPRIVRLKEAQQGRARRARGKLAVNVRKRTPRWEDFVPPSDVPVDKLWTPERVKERLVEAALAGDQDVLAWIDRYLLPRTGPANALLAFLEAQGPDKSFDSIIRRNGWAKSTAIRARDCALGLIAIGLNRDGVERDPGRAAP